MPFCDFGEDLRAVEVRIFVERVEVRAHRAGEEHGFLRKKGYAFAEGLGVDC